MNFNSKLAGAVLFIALGSCTVKKELPQPVASDKLVLDGKIWASLWQQRAAEYKALCFQAYNIARLKLDFALQNRHNKPLAIITDIDETVLDNSPNTVSQSLAGKDFEPQSWYAWTDKAIADTVPGAAAFLKYAASKNVSVYYITNREERERESTLKNLTRFGLPNTDNAHLLLKQTSSGKEPRRLEVLKTHEVILLIGDNLSDFSNVFDKQPEGTRTNVTQSRSANFGDRFIVLPNVMYGDWEGSIFQYNYKMSGKEKSDIIKKALKGE